MLDLISGGFKIARQQKIQIGDLLVKEGLINEDQLKEALKAQAIYGGKLGTNLVEMGYLEEEALAYFLSEKLDVPYAHPQAMTDIDGKIISTIGRNIAEKYKVLPFELKRRRLKLVMADPMDLNAINEISFITGFIIEPMVTPEARLLEALKRYYDIPLQTRFRPAPKSMKDSLAVDGEKKEKSDGTNKIEKDEVSEEIIKEKVDVLKDKRRAMLLDEPATQKIEEKTPEEIPEVHKKLLEAPDRDSVANVLIDFLLQDYSGAAIFVAKKDRAEGWKARGDGLDDLTAKKIIIPLTVPSILKDAAGTKFIAGDEPKKKPMDKMIRRLLKADDSLKIVVTSIYYKKVVACFLAALVPKDTTGEGMRNKFVDIADRAGEAFARLIHESMEKGK